MQQTGATQQYISLFPMYNLYVRRSFNALARIFYVSHSVSDDPKTNESHYTADNTVTN